MANWCKNRLEISCGKDACKQLAEFLSKAKGTDTDLSLDNFVPTPPALESQESPGDYEKLAKQHIADYGYPDGDKWRCANWGTRDVDDARLIESCSNFAVFDFDSAWSPPTAWLKTVSMQYPDLEFQLRYEEIGMCFMGIALSKNGKLKDQTIEYGAMWQDMETTDEDEDLHTSASVGVDILSPSGLKRSAGSGGQHD
ncbi:MAG: DUF1281 family ferredoxin-like fold protein [Planctomycetota bacterium]|jgi:hypothetical protein